MNQFLEQVTAVVVAFRSADTLSACLSSLLEDPLVARVIVVDNSEDPKSADVVARYGAASVYLASENTGFAAGCNKGLQLVETPFVAFINPDLQLVGSLGPLVEFLDGHPGALVAGESSTTSASSARLTVTPLRELKKSVLGSRAYALPRFTGQEPVRVEQLSGALIVGATSFVREIGGFDERFELYYEDVDICRRASNGDGCWLLPAVVARHSGGASFHHSGGTAFTASRVSRIRYLRKHYPPAVAVCTSVLATVAECLVRTAMRQPEGHVVRGRTVAASFRELRRPGTIQVLRRGGHAR